MRFTIYSSDPKEPWPLIEIDIRSELVAKAVKAGTFPMERVTPLFQKAVADVQNAINTGKGNVTTKQDGNLSRIAPGASAKGGPVVAG